MGLFEEIKFEREHFKIEENDFRKLLVIKYKLPLFDDKRFIIDNFYQNLIRLNLQVKHFKKLPKKAKELIILWLETILEQLYES